VRLLLASDNPHKRAELEGLLAPFPIELLTPAQVGGLPPVDEDRPTFAENAARKAVCAARESGLWALADDSGLEVEALGGEPGVRSARFAGRHGDDAANNALLLERLAGLPPGRRGARFVCALALARPDASLALEVEGEARGQVLERARGRGGFGYDPLFLFTEEGFDETGRAFAELSGAQKARVSHRGRALRRLVEALPTILGPAPA
jgi:XTP/dITP diphosphohydrolase